jgi:hypothetical protein
MPENRIPLPAVPRELAAITGGPTNPYTRLYKGALNAEFPVLQGDNGRYSVERADLPTIARIFGLPTKRTA